MKTLPLSPEWSHVEVSGTVHLSIAAPGIDPQRSPFHQSFRMKGQFGWMVPVRRIFSGLEQNGVTACMFATPPGLALCL